MEDATLAIKGLFPPCLVICKAKLKKRGGSFLSAQEENGLEFFLIGCKEGGVVAREAVCFQDCLFDILGMGAGVLGEPCHLRGGADEVGILSWAHVDVES